MLTYQLQSRIFQIESDDQFSFPNVAEVELKLGPATTFGTDSSLSRTLVRAHRATIIINANTGRWLAKSDPPLDPLEVIVETKDSKLVLDGDVLRYDFRCADISQLESTLTAFKWVFPTLLNLKFAEPPIISTLFATMGCIQAEPGGRRIKMEALPNMDIHPHPKRHLAKTPTLKWRMYQTRHQGRAGRGLFRKFTRSTLLSVKNVAMI